MQFTTPINSDSFCNKVWLATVEEENGQLSYFVIGEGGGFLTIRFTENHRIETLSLTNSPDHFSGYAFWDYDPKEHQLIILNRNQRPFKRFNLPENASDGSIFMRDVNHPNEKLVLDTSVDVVKSAPLGGLQMAYLFGSDWSLERQSTSSKFLFNQNFNIHKVLHGRSENKINLETLLDIHEHLMQHPKIEQVIIAGSFEILFSKLSDSTYLTSQDYLLVASNELITGYRSWIIELLDILIIKIYHYQLNHNNAFPDWEELLQNTLDQYFTDRYQRV